MAQRKAALLVNSAQFLEIGYPGALRLPPRGEYSISINRERHTETLLMGTLRDKRVCLRAVAAAQHVRSGLEKNSSAKSYRKKQTKKTILLILRSRTFSHSLGKAEELNLSKCFPLCTLKTDIAQCSRHVCFVPILLQKSVETGLEP